MIYNNGLNTTNQTQSRSEKQPVDIQQTLTQLQSLPAFQANNSPLMQNLMQLIQTLTQQLQEEPQQSELKEKPNTRKEGGSKQNKDTPQEQNQTTALTPEGTTEPRNHIIGTEGNDKLKGSYGDDYILGLGGNDQLRGHQGNDFLSGGAGRDRLYGGSGNDTLVGGEGNDYLSGGRGNNVLLGGEGNDVLASRLGSDYLDGGSGQDTARIRAKLDDYTISTLSQPTDSLKPIFLGPPEKTDGFVLKHKETGQVITVVNTENFRFNDIRLTSDELRSRIEDQNPPRLDLSASQNKNLQKLFGYTAASEKSIFVLDKDHDGKVSVGDEAIVFDNRADPAPGSDGIIARKILTADDVKKINANEVNDIPLDKTQQRHALDLFGYIASGNEKVRVLDQDGNGKISVGDIAMLGSQQYILDKPAVRQITDHPKGEQLKLDDQQKQQALALFDTPVSRSITYFVDVYDSNGDGKVSKGDTAILMKSPSVIPMVEGYHNSRTEVERVSLTEAQVAQINGTKPPQQLKLTEAEYTAISNHFNRTPTDGVFDGLTIKFTGVAIDKDGNGKLSVGDVVKLHYSGGIAGFNEVRDHVLTKDDLNAIQSAQPLKLTKAEHKAIANHFNRTPPIGTADGFTIRFTGIVLDQNNDGKLSVGDTVKLHRTGGFAGVDEIINHTLTKSDISAIQGNHYKEIPLNSKQQQRALDLFRPFHTGGEFVRILDVNGDGKVSKGDIAIHLEKPDPRPLNPEKNPEIELGRMVLSEQQASVINGTALADAQKELNQNQQKWEKNDIQDYSYQFQRSCFCPQEITRPVNINVQNGNVSNASFADTKGKPPEQNQQSINGLFAIIQDAIDRGRQVEVKYDAKTGMPTKIVIDRNQMPVDGGQTITATNLQINSVENELKLTDKQQDAIGARFNRKPPPNLMDAPTIHYTGVAIDKDGDGKLGVGDVVKLKSIGGFRPQNVPNETLYDHVLTEADIAFIEKDRSNPLLDISKGLSMEQRQRLNTVLNVGNGRLSGIGKIYDNNSDGKLSAGDTITIERYFANSTPVPKEASNGQAGVAIEFHTLTQDEIDQYLQGSNNNVQARADFETNQLKWEGSHPDKYSITLQRNGFIAGDARKPVELTIQDGKVIDARFSDGSKAMVPEYNQLSVNDLFKTIGDALDNNAAKVEVKYNSETGIPETIFIDRSEMIADEELFLNISNFKNLDNQNGGTLTLSDAQKKSVNSVFNIRNATVEDNNGDGKISAGDTVTGTLFREAGTINVSYEISEDNADHINGRYTELQGTNQQTANIAEALNLSGKHERIQGVLDRDGNGKLSVGDIVYTRSNLATTGGDPIGGSPNYYHLSVEDINNINNNTIVDPDNGVVSGGGISIGGTGHLDGVVIPNDRIVEIKGENYSVGFLKDQVDNYASSSYVPTGAVDAAFGIFEWGTSNSMAAGAAFQSYIADTYPAGEILGENG